MSEAMDIIAFRRELHRYPESAWTEYRTTCRIIEELKNAGIDVRFGTSIHCREKMLDLPTDDTSEFHRALDEGCNPALLEKMRGGFTGCVAEIHGAKPGKTIAFRVDIDSNELNETDSPNHRSVREGFSSKHPGKMHACGHDGHAAIGVFAAKALQAQRNALCGTVRFLFQPSEEGSRGGAASLIAAGAADGVDTLFGLHLGLGLAPVGKVAVAAYGFMASTKLDVYFHGKAAHAGNCPEKGHNALAAAALAVTELLRLPSDKTRLNVGTFRAESGRNVIPPEALIKFETRALSTEENRILEEAALRVCTECAQKYGCTIEVKTVGGVGTAECSTTLASRTAEVLRARGLVKEIIPSFDFRAGEDITEFLNFVRGHGGSATELVFGTDITSPHHSKDFDFDEAVLPLASDALTALAFEFTKGMF